MRLEITFIVLWSTLGHCKTEGVSGEVGWQLCSKLFLVCYVPYKTKTSSLLHFFFLMQCRRAFGYSDQTRLTQSNTNSGSFKQTSQTQPDSVEQFWFCHIIESLPQQRQTTTVNTSNGKGCCLKLSHWKRRD